MVRIVVRFGTFEEESSEQEFIGLLVKDEGEGVGRAMRSMRLKMSHRMWQVCRGWLLK